MKPRWIIIRLVAITLLDIALVFTSLCLAPDVYAQEPNSISQKPASSGHFIRRWLTLGPIVEGEPAPKAIETDYLLLATGIPESKFATLEDAPKVGDSLNLTLEGYVTQERIWKVLELPETGDVDGMLVAEGEVEFAVVYLITFVESKEATNRELIVVSYISTVVFKF